jgi:hypothetical protein
MALLKTISVQCQLAVLIFPPIDKFNGLA